MIKIIIILVLDIKFKLIKKTKKLNIFIKFADNKFAYIVLINNFFLIKKKNN